MELAIILGVSVLALIFAAFYLTPNVMKRDQGTAAMQRISNAIKLGAEAFLRRQNKTIVTLAVAVAALIFVIYGFVRAHNPHDPVNSAMTLAIWTTLSFILGALCSVAAG